VRKNAMKREIARIFEVTFAEYVRGFRGGIQTIGRLKNVCTKAVRCICVYRCNRNMPAQHAGKIFGAE